MSTEVELVEEKEGPSTSMEVELAEEKGEVPVAEYYTGDMRGNGDWKYTSDGKRIVNMYEMYLYVYSAVTGENELTIKNETISDKYAAFSLTPDSRSAVVANESGRRLRKLSLATGEVELEVQMKQEAGNLVTGVEVTHDGSTVFVSRTDRSLSAWSLSDGKHLRTFEGVGGRILAVIDHERVLTGGYEARQRREGPICVRVLDTETGETLVTLEDTERLIVDSHPGLTPDRRFAIVATKSATNPNAVVLCIWSLVTGAVERSLASPEGGLHPNGVNVHPAVTPDGRRVVTLGRVWRFDTGEIEREEALRSRHSNGTAVASPDGVHVLNNGVRSLARDAAAEAGPATFRLLKRGQSAQNGLPAVALSPGDGDTLAFVAPDSKRSLQLLSLSSADEPQARVLCKGHKGNILSVAWMPRGDRVVSADSKTVRVWDAGSGELLNTIEPGTEVHAVASFSDYGTLAVLVEDSGGGGGDEEKGAGGGGYALTVWDVHAAKEVGRVRVAGRHMDGSEDHSVVVTYGDGPHCVWENRGGRRPKLVSELPTDNTMSTYAKDKGRTVWSFGTGDVDPPVYRLTKDPGNRRNIHLGHAQPLRGVAAPSNIERVITAGWGNTVRVAPALARDAHEPTMVLRMDGYLTNVVCNRRLLVVANTDGNAFAMKVESLAGLRLSFPEWAVRQEVLECAGRTVDGISTHLAERVPPRSWARVPDIFVESVRGGKLDLFEALLQQKVLVQPFERWSELLDAAVRTRSRRAVSLVTNALLRAARARNVSRLVLGERPAWALECPQDDDGMVAALTLLVERFPLEARALLAELPLVVASACVSHGIDGLADLRAAPAALPSETDAPELLWARALPERAAAVTAAATGASGGASAPGADDDQLDGVVAVEAGLVTFPGLAGPDSRFLDAVLRTGDSEMFSGPTVRAVVSHKWEAFGRARFLRRLVLYLLELALVVALGLLVDDFATDAAGRADDRSARHLAVLATGGALALTTLQNVSYEASQVRLIGLGVYLSEPWNMLDVLNLALQAATLALLATGEGAARPMLAVLLLTKWLGLFFFMQPWRSTGPLVTMLIQIVADIRYFLLVMGVAVLAVGFAFFVLLDGESGAEGFASPAGALFTMFRLLLLSDFDVDTLAVGEYALAVRLIFVLGMVMVPIVALNVLIAVLSDTYEQIQDVAEVEFQKLRARIVLEQELFLTAAERSNARHFPRHVHVLLPRGALLEPALGTGDGQWQGVLHALKYEAATGRRELDTKMTALDARVAEVDARVAALGTKVGTVETALAGLGNTVAGINEKLDRVLAALAERDGAGDAETRAATK